VFVGVSSGAYISALLSNGVTPALLYRNVTRSASSGTALDDLALFHLNVSEIASRAAAAPRTILEAAWHFYQNSRETTLTDLVQSLGQLLPLVCSRTKDSRSGWPGGSTAPAEPTTSASSTRYSGSSPWSWRPATRSPSARKARGRAHLEGRTGLLLHPGLYRPTKIDGVEYIDGGVKKTANISLALRERCGLTLCINPIVPFGCLRTS